MEINDDVKHSQTSTSTLTKTKLKRNNKAQQKKKEERNSHPKISTINKSIFMCTRQLKKLSNSPNIHTLCTHKRSMKKKIFTCLPILVLIVLININNTRDELKILREFWSFCEQILCLYWVMRGWWKEKKSYSVSSFFPSLNWKKSFKLVRFWCHERTKVLKKSEILQIFILKFSGQNQVQKGHKRVKKLRIKLSIKK